MKECKENDLVVYNDSDLHFPEFFPPFGTVGKVIYYNKEKDPNGCWVEWPEGSLKVPEGNCTADLAAATQRVRYCLLHRLKEYDPTAQEETVEEDE